MSTPDEPRLARPDTTPGSERGEGAGSPPAAHRARPLPRRAIAIIVPSLSHGGAERVAATLANRWATHPDLTVHVVTFSALGDFFNLDPAVRRINMRLRPRPGPLALLGLALRIRRHLVREKVSSALSFMDRYNVFNLIALIGTGIPLTVSDRSNPLKPLPAWLRALKRLTYPRAATVIAQTRQAAAEISRRTGARRVVAIPNPLATRGAVRSGTRGRLVLNVGRLIPEKGQAHLIRAFAAADLPGWRLAILGEGPLRKELEAEAEAAGIRDRLDMPGVVEDVAAWSERASIFAFPSVSEGFPNALIEAMGAGLPCVSFDCDAGPREIINDGVDGLLIPVGDEAGLARALRRLSERSALRRQLGQAARARVQAFDAETISIQYLQACAIALLPPTDRDSPCASS